MSLTSALPTLLFPNSAKEGARRRWAWWGTMQLPLTQGFSRLQRLSSCSLSHHLPPKALGGREGTYYSPLIQIRKSRLGFSVVCLKEEALRRGCVCLVVRNTGSLGTDLLRGDTKIPTLLLNM